MLYNRVLAADRGPGKPEGGLLMFSQISWDGRSRRSLVVLQKRVPPGYNVELSLGRIHGMRRVLLHADRGIVEFQVDSDPHRSAADVAMLELCSRGLVRPATWWG